MKENAPFPSVSKSSRGLGWVSWPFWWTEVLLHSWLSSLEVMWSHHSDGIASYKTQLWWLQQIFRSGLEQSCLKLLPPIHSFLVHCQQHLCWLHVVILENCTGLGSMKIHIGARPEALMENAPSLLYWSGQVLGQSSADFILHPATPLLSCPGSPAKCPTAGCSLALSAWMLFLYCCSLWEIKSWVLTLLKAAWLLLKSSMVQRDMMKSRQK